jgi:hypothetical protein
MFTEQDQVTAVVLFSSYVCYLSPESQGFMNAVFIFITRVSELHFMIGFNSWIMTLTFQPCMPSLHSKYSAVYQVNTED